MMTFENFCEEIRNNVKHYLPEIYKNAQASVIDCQKLNTTYKGLMVKRENETITQTINMDQLYKTYQNHPGITMESVYKTVADVIMETPIQMNLKSIMDYDSVKDHLFIRVSSAETNKDMLANVPHQLKEDLAITYHVAVSMDEEGLSSMLIKNDLLKQYGITAEQLHEDAMKNSPRIMAPEVSSLGAMMEELIEKDLFMMSPEEREMLQESIRESAQMPSFFVVTNHQKINGAGALFYLEMLDNLGKVFGQNYFILPSSIHEMLVLPDNGEISADELRAMVTEVNATQVAPAERLTNNVYHYDVCNHDFKVC